MERPITAAEQDILNRLPEPTRCPPTPTCLPPKRNLLERLESGELVLPTEAEVRAKFCAWSLSGDGFWETECKNNFEFIDGDPSDNKFAFCPYCGKRLDNLDCK